MDRIILILLIIPLLRIEFLEIWTAGCLQEDTVFDVFTRGSEGADISIIEGVMGFFDGKNPVNNAGSTAEISMITKSPVLLVVNCASMARSAAAIVKGFQTLLMAQIL